MDEQGLAEVDNAIEILEYPANHGATGIIDQTMATALAYLAKREREREKAAEAKLWREKQDRENGEQLERLRQYKASGKTTEEALAEEERWQREHKDRDDPTGNRRWEGGRMMSPTEVEEADRKAREGGA